MVAKSVSREKQARFQTALELAEALEPFLSDDAAEKLARRISTHFDFMPRTKEEAVGIDKPAGPRRRTSLSASPRATTSVPKPGSKPKGASGSKKRAAASVTQQEPAPKRRGGLALFAIIVLPLIALGVLLGSGLAAKFAPPVEPVVPAAPEETVAPELPAEPVDAGAAAAPKKKAR